MATRNVLIESKLRKANQFYAQHRLADAAALYREISQRAGGHAEVWIRLGEVNRKLGRFADAEAASRRAITLAPSHPLAQYELGAALHCLGRIPDAVPHYRQALKADANLLDALFLLSKALIYLGDKVEAEELLQRAHSLKPDFVPVMSSLAGLLVEQGELSRAKEMLDRVQASWPEYPEALCHLAFAAIKEGRDEEAIAFYQRALRANPSSDEALSNYSDLLERLGRLDEAEPQVMEGLRRSPGHSKLNITLGKIHRRAQRWPEAIAAFEMAAQNAPSPSIAGSSHMLLGQALDQLERADEAFIHFEQGNRLTCQGDRIGDISVAQQEYLDRVRYMEESVTDALVCAPSFAHESSNESTTPIFLVGFPRSGTTLLEQILDAHPSLQTIEEQPMVAEMLRAFVEMTNGQPDTISRLSEKQVRQLREVYFSELAKHLQLRPGAILVDKLPLNIVATPLIWRVFPEAKYILAIRHPFDACLSCFMQDFLLNTAMTNFVTLDASLTLYQRVMSLWQRCVQYLPLQYHRIRYEDLVNDFENEIGRVLAFLGLPWDESVRGYRERSLNKLIDTPSYHQVTRPLYQNAVYRWQRYEKYFTPHAAAMAPYLKMFDYEP